jgi:hypothetical protein
MVVAIFGFSFLGLQVLSVWNVREGLWFSGVLEGNV